MPLFIVEFRDGTDGLSTVCQPVVTDTPDHAADIAYGIAGHIASTGNARVITMTVSEVAAPYTAPVVIDTPVSYQDFLSHVATWITFHTAGTVEFDDIPDYGYIAAYAGTMHASDVARGAIAATGVLA